MAESKNNIVTHGLSGKIGNQLVFRNRNGKTIVSSRPSRYGKASEVQIQHQRRFQEAVLYAKSVLADEDLKAAYAAKVQKSGKFRSAYNLAIADFMHAPDIREINLGNYHGHEGDTITITATDELLVKEVSVTIWNTDGVLVESGLAILAADGIHWVYTAQTDNTSLEGDKIIVRASDIPGNVSKSEKTL